MQELPIFNDGIWGNVVDVWTSGQVGLPQVERWSTHKTEDNEHGGIRSQNSLQHTYSLALLGSMLIQSARPYHSGLDEVLLLNALLVHDHGEAELGRDVVYINKYDQADLDEYGAFCKRYRKLPQTLFAFYHEAFLLQFANQKPIRFPLKARKVMNYLRSQKQTECKFFEFIERWDYLVYALEQYIQRGNEKILVQVLRHQFPKLEKLAQDVPACKELVWTPAVSEWCSEFMQIHSGKWIEIKSK